MEMEMETNILEEIKTKYAITQGFESWNDMFYDLNSFKRLNERINVVIRLYAKECCKASLENGNKELNKALKTNDYDYSVEELINHESNIVLL